jgi:hypothetical protein
MPNYPELARIMKEAKPDMIEDAVAPYLIEVWLAQYWMKNETCDVVETSQSGCSYLFDTLHQRLIAAWTTSRGHHSGTRDRNRMRSHPQGFGSRYHRGHAIPHSAGGPTDINLVPQLGSVNVGPFRDLERKAVSHVGSLYFTHWIYADESQKPVSVEQGLLIPGLPPNIIAHSN